MTDQTIINASDTTAPGSPTAAEGTVFAILMAVSIGHFINDVIQSLLSAIYPLLKDDFGLAFWQIGLLTLTFQFTASLLQPAIGLYTDRRPMPYSLLAGMLSTLAGLLFLAFAHTYGWLLIGATLVGIGSAIFHPEASRLARVASGGRYGLAQSVFQVGGNFGQAIGPLAAAFIVVPRGQGSIAWFCVAALFGMLLLGYVSRWYARWQRAGARHASVSKELPFSTRRVIFSLVILAVLVFTKNTYTAGISSFYTFYVIEHFDLTVQQSQLMLFLFLAAMALGTVIGGPIGDRIGAKTVIWVSILGCLPFTLLMPYTDLFWTGVLSCVIGVVLASAFPAIVVFAQELVPGRVGMIAGIFFGFAFGMGGIAAAVLGVVADAKGIEFVFRICSYIPFLGLLTIFLPNMRVVARQTHPA